MNRRGLALVAALGLGVVVGFCLALALPSHALTGRLLDLLERHGFAVVVALWLLVRTETRLTAVARSVEGLRRAIELRWPIQGDLSAFLARSRQPEAHPAA